MEVTSNRDDHDRKFEQAVKKALRLIGGQAERIAKENISDMKAVDTGFLRNSITFALAGEQANIAMYTDDNGVQEGEYAGSADEDEDDNQFSVYIGSNVYYAPYVEYGTVKMGARPFLTNAIQGHQSEYKELFERAFEIFK